MDDPLRGREDLKSYFETHKIPTEQQFAELIDGMLNQTDDGVVKSANKPLSLVADANSGETQPVLQLLQANHDPAGDPADWVLSLKPHAGTAAGLTVSDGQGHDRLFIDQATGQIGIGTTAPQAMLHVDGTVKFGGELDIGENLALKPDGKIGVGTKNPDYPLHVVGDRIRLQSADDAGRTLDLRTDVVGGGLDLEASQPLTINRNGQKVTIGGVAPDGDAAKSGGLEVVGPVKAGGDLSVEKAISATGNIQSGGTVSDMYGPVVPPGVIMMFGGQMDKVPMGWMACDGRPIPDDDRYAALKDALGGSNAVPDLRSRFIVGAGQGRERGLSDYKVGANEGGAERVELTIEEMPPHNHAVSVSEIGAHQHGVVMPGSANTQWVVTKSGSVHIPMPIGSDVTVQMTDSHWINLNYLVDSANGLTEPSGQHTPSVSIELTGGEVKQPGSPAQTASHNNLPPFYALIYIIKY